MERNINDMNKFIDTSRLAFPSQCFSGMGLDPYVLRDVVGYLQENDINNIVEFGSGASTEFLLSLRESNNLKFSLTSFDHSIEYCFKPTKQYNNFNLMLRELIQYTDEEFMGIMEGEDIPEGIPLPIEMYGNFRVKNVFYNIEPADLDSCYDMVILDGPNGNGRSMAFRYLVDKVRPGTKIIIDDYHHYPFVENCKNLLNVSILKHVKIARFSPTTWICNFGGKIVNNIYLKTYFYVEHEIPFLIMNLVESYEHIDKFIICEHNRTHTGRPRDFIFENHRHKFPTDMMDKIVYLKQDISDETVEAYENEAAIHAINEPVMRSRFMKDMSFDDEDIVISVDADEIIYRDSYPYILSEVESKNCVRLNLNQFFYKTNYLWEDKDFVSPIAVKYKVFKNHYPCNWRDVGPVVSKKVGCHFSWCMSPEEMVYKLHTYSHPKYRFCANVDLLTKAIKDKKYPFDDGTDFRIKELSMDDERLPISLRNKNILKEK